MTSIELASILPFASANPTGVVLALAGTIDSGLERGLRTPLLIRGIGDEEFGCLLDTHFPGVREQWHELDVAVPQAAPDDEFDDVRQLLLEARSNDLPDTRWLAHAVATAAMYDNHLWQDLRLSDRELLSALLLEHFPAMALKNVAHMRWKKFFYKQLCEQAEIFTCKSPICSTCCDYVRCFGPEEGEAWSRRSPRKPQV